MPQSAGVALIFEGLLLTNKNNNNNMNDANEETFLASEEYQILFKKMTSGFALHEMIYDKDGRPCNYRFLKVNPAFAAITDISKERLINNTVLDVLPKTEHYWIETFAKVLETGEPVHFENFNSETKKLYEVTAYKHRENQFAALYNDVTELRRAQKSEKQLESKLLDSEKMKTIAVLAGGIAHDLNNILGPIVILPGLMEYDLQDIHNNYGVDVTEMSDNLRTISTSAKRAAGVIKNLMTLNRRGTYKRTPININNVINNWLTSPDYMELTKANRCVSLALNLSDNLPLILGSGIHLERVLSNLTRNAFESITDNGTVNISTTSVHLKKKLKSTPPIKPGKYIKLSIADTGTGINSEDVDAIFDAFFSKKKHTKTSGSGLGLCIVDGILKDHNAGILVSSHIDKGTLFEIYFPTATKNSSPIAGKKTIIRKGSEHILIVDDEPNQRLIARRVLSRLGYKISEASNGHEALKLFSEYSKTHPSGSPYDLVVMDVIMEEGFDGITTLESIYRIYPEQKAIIATGFANEEREKLAKEMNAAWISKPYTPDDIAISVRNELDKDKFDS